MGHLNQPQLSEIPTGSEIILLVDDKEAIRDLAKQALMKFGFKVISAFSGEQAIEVYKAKPDVIDLILMDLGMPGMGGYKCLQELLKLDPHVKVVIASGYSFDQQVKQTMDAGAAGFIGKPYKIKDLINTVRMVLDH